MRVDVAVLTSLLSGFRGRKAILEPCFGIGLSLSLICQPTSEDIKHHDLPKSAGLIVQELCESRGGRPGLSVLTSLLVSVDVKNY